MKYNNEFKLIDTQEKAYFFGFMYGDGTITTYEEGNGRIRYLTKISISIDDSKMIQQLQKTFPFFNLGEFDYSKYNLNCKKQISISKSSKELYYDLIGNGLFPRKSYENANNLHMPDISDELIPHFIRGFFDADGSVYRRAKRKNLITIEFCSVSKEILIDINNYFISKNIESWKIIEKKHVEGRQICYVLQIIKTSEILKCVELMYTNSTISLKRKSDKCLNYIPANRILDKHMNCPYCNSNLIVRGGIRGKSTRYECKNCKKGFSLKNNVTI